MSDPTGTSGLRRVFLAEGNRRLAQVRSATHSILVEHDLMQARATPWAQLFPQPGHRLSVFAQWFERTTNEQLLSMRWWEKYLQRAYDSGLVAGGELVRASSASISRPPLPAVFTELARRELGGIAAALVQQVSRQAGQAALVRRKPQLMYRAVLTAIKKVGMARLKAFVNFITVQIHNAARLEHFRAAGVTQVGIIPERLVHPKPSRFLRHDHAMHDASVAERLSAATTTAEELLAKQRRKREERLAQQQAELEAKRARMAAQIGAEMAGARAPVQSAAQARLELRIAQARARAEVETAKTATAAQEVAAKAAWEKVLVARKEARAAEYAATRAVKAAGAEKTAAEATKIENTRTAAVATQARAVETEATVVRKMVVGAFPLPARLLAIGAEYVNVLTAGDDLVCQICEDISEEGPYSLDEAQGLIPAHPNCRCAFVPAISKSELTAVAAE